MLKLIQKFIFNKVIFHEYYGYKDEIPDILNINKLYDNYDYYKLFYEYDKKHYIVISKFCIYKKIIIENSSKKVENKIIYGYVQNKGKTVNITDILISLSGPQCNFHDCYIDFKWIFEDYQTLTILFVNSLVVFDINSNKVISGENIYVKLLT